MIGQDTSTLVAEVRQGRPPLVEAAAPDLDLALVEIHGGRGRADLEALRELWRFREVVGAFVKRQVLVKYKQAFVGIGWAVVQPIVGALLFALFLGRFTHIGSEGVPYVVFVLAGTSSWSFFSGATSNSMESVVRDQTLLRKVYFPREILPLTAVLAALVDFAPALGTVVAATLLTGIAPALTWLALPLPLLLLTLTALGIGLAISGLNVYYRDVRYLLPFLIQLGLFSSPVIFSLDVVPERWRLLYGAINPAASAIDDMRRLLIHHTWPQPGMNALALAWALLLVAGGYWLFKRLERGFADRV
ncbi:MAG TPA: ABC transporter permease [Gaiellaceae bacterium]|nr:ABC transporter permease [Gaiellaceae bacterium]